METWGTKRPIVYIDHKTKEGERQAQGMDQTQPPPLQSELGSVKKALEVAHRELLANPGNADLLNKERDSLRKYKNLLDMEELEMRQKAEEDWLVFRDRFSKNFHNIMKGKKQEHNLSHKKGTWGMSERTRGDW